MRWRRKVVAVGALCALSFWSLVLLHYPASREPVEVYVPDLTTADAVALLDAEDLAILTTAAIDSPRPYTGSPPVPVNYIDCQPKNLKQVCALAIVKHMQPNTLVILADSDIIYSNWTIDMVIDAFDDYGTEILVGGERNDHPSCKLHARIPSDELHDLFPNSGFIMGRVRHLVQLLQHIASHTSILLPSNNDQLLLQDYWVYHYNNSRKIRVDQRRTLVRNLHDWSSWYSTEHSPEEIRKRDALFAPSPRCRVPWYFKEVCDIKSAFRLREWRKQCTDTSIRLSCRGLAMCARAYEVTGCRIAQKLIANREVTAKEMSRAINDDYSDELWEFLPYTESFAYHGNGRGMETYERLVGSHRRSCHQETNSV